jgi:predicted DNA repair protein MutK
MAGSSLLALIDDIATLLDDVAILSKVALKKTAGVLGDDLALNAEQVMGVKADRQLPVVLAVAKGSLLNKCILVPAALLISIFIPVLITVLLMLGGAFLCYEGAEKVMHKFFKKKCKQEHKEFIEAVVNNDIDLVEFETKKVKGAIRTDFILSAEIIVITLGSVADESLLNQFSVLVAMAIGITFGVYGLVAAIVKLDDFGYFLIKNQAEDFLSSVKRKVGKVILLLAPKLMKGLSIVGTIAMFIVGGGIILHGIPESHELFLHITEVVDIWPYLGPAMALATPTLTVAVAGLVIGLLLVAVMTLIKSLRSIIGSN